MLYKQQNPLLSASVSNPVYLLSLLGAGLLPASCWQLLYYDTWKNQSLPWMLSGHPSSSRCASVRSNYGECFTREGPKKISCGVAAAWHWGQQTLPLHEHWYQFLRHGFLSLAHFSLSPFSRLAQPQAAPRPLEHRSFRHALRAKTLWPCVNNHTPFWERQHTHPPYLV